MKKIYQKIERIRGSGMATLNLELSSPYYHLNAKRFPVNNIGKPGIKCLVILLINSLLVDFTIEEIF